jgi:hypothetical protein
MMMAAEAQSKKLTLSMAIKRVEESCDNVRMNDGFMSKLVALEKRLYGEVMGFWYFLTISLLPKLPLANREKFSCTQ